MKGYVERPFAHCCAEAGGDVSRCDCVHKNHGTAWFASSPVEGLTSGEVDPQEYLEFAAAMHARLFHPSGASRDDAKPYQIARYLGMAVKILANALAASPRPAATDQAGEVA